MPLLFFICLHTTFVIMLLLHHIGPWKHPHEALLGELEVELLFFLLVSMLMYTPYRPYFFMLEPPFLLKQNTMMFTLLQIRTLLFMAWHLVYYGRRNVVWKFEMLACVFTGLVAGLCMKYNVFLVLHGSISLARSGPLDRVQIPSWPSVFFFVFYALSWSGPIGTCCRIFINVTFYYVVTCK